jgi:hypothetical protein
MMTLTNDLREIKGVCESPASIVSNLKTAKLEEEPTSDRAIARPKSIGEL